MPLQLVRSKRRAEDLIDRIQASGIANRIMEDIRGLAYTKITNGIPNSELAADSVFWTTVASCVTMTAWLVVIRLWMG